MLWVFVVRTSAWCSYILEMWSIHTGEQINIQAKDLKRGKDCVTFHRTTAYHCCHSMHAFTGSCEKFSLLRYDSYQRFLESTNPERIGQGRFSRLFLFFRALVSLALSARFLRFSLEFRMWSTSVFHVSIKWHFLFTISLSGSAL